MKTNSSTINGKLIQLTRDVEANEELLGRQNVQALKAFRKKCPNVDLSIYSVKVEEEDKA